MFEAAASLGAAVFVHPWDMVGRDRMTQYWLPWLVGMPTEVSLAICSLIFGGVLERLPALRIAFAHGGGVLSGDDRPNRPAASTRGPICAPFTTPCRPREYLRRIYVDSLVHDPLTLRYLVDLIGPERIALGTRLSVPARRGSPGRADRFVRIPAGDPGAAAARHGARVARPSRRALRWMSR